MLAGPSLAGAPGPGTLVKVALSKSSSAAFQENCKAAVESMENQALSDAELLVPCVISVSSTGVIMGIWLSMVKLGEISITFSATVSSYAVALSVYDPLVSVVVGQSGSE